MPRALALPRDVMTTVTVNHTFTTTIASPPPPRTRRPRWSHPPRVDVVVAAVAPPVGTSTRRHTSTDLATRARSIARAENTTTDSDSDLDARHVADDRVREHSRPSFHCIRASRAFVRTRARIRRARRARRGFGRRERWCSRERARVRLARGATRGRGARAARTETRDERDERDERFLPGKGK